MFLHFKLKSLKNYIIILYDFGKQTGEIVLLERPQSVPKKFICFDGERLKS